MKLHDDLSDEELMMAYQNGQADAFQLLYKRHSARVYGYLMSKTRDRSLADDVFQSVFLKLHKSRGRYDSKLPFAPWLFTICRNALIDNGRRMSRLNEEPLDVASVASDIKLSDKISFPANSSLSPQQRQAIELKFNDYLSFEEIAVQLNTTALNVRQLLSRGIKKLRKLSLIGEKE